MYISRIILVTALLGVPNIAGAVDEHGVHTEKKTATFVTKGDVKTANFGNIPFLFGHSEEMFLVGVTYTAKKLHEKSGDTYQLVVDLTGAVWDGHHGGAGNAKNGNDFGSQLLGPDGWTRAVQPLHYDISCIQSKRAQQFSYTLKITKVTYDLLEAVMIPEITDSSHAC